MHIINPCLAALALIAAAQTNASAQSLSIDGYNFAVIGDPGNRDTVNEIPMYPDERIGGVDYEYWMATMEVTVGQYLEFVIAYYPFYVKTHGEGIAFVDFSGTDILAAFGEVHVRPNRSEDSPTDMGWEYAARYCNWLHHGKVIEEWAFETGVYDTSTFVQDKDGNWLTQAARNPGSRFWMPTWDEWTKAGYWDPNKNNGEGGYWLYPNTSDIEPHPGFPDEGGERNAGDSDEFPLAVGSYPQVKSPWGIYDMSGGQSEYTETPIRPDRLFRRVLGGTDYLNDSYGVEDSRDILGYGNSLSTFNSQYGLRLGMTSGFQPADLNQDHRVNFFDISQFIRWFVDRDARADLRLDGEFDLDDLRVLLGLIDLAF